MSTSDTVRILGMDWRFALVLGVALPVTYAVYSIIYNLFFHPLKDYPGPIHWRASRIPYVFMLVRGAASWEIKALHDKYGEVVRVAPAELVYANPKAWQDIMGHRKATQSENGKDLRYIDLQFSTPDIISSDRDDHRRYRRILSHGFSAQALLDQQPLIMHYVNLLITQLLKKCEDGKQALDMTAWYNFTTFDIIGDLTFGDSFSLLENGTYHPWVSAIFGSVKAGTYMRCVNYFPSVKWIMEKLIPKQTAEKRRKHKQFTIEKVRSRLESGVKRPDYVDTILTHRQKESGGMSEEEIESNANILIIAGSETTATTLSGATYLCLANPHVLEKVTNEVRSTFKSDSEIDLNSASRLDYMLAMLEETMRMYPPVPTTNFRRVPAGGNFICDRYVPEDTTVSIFQLAVFRNDKYFKNPEKFAPERWLGDEEYKDDARDTFQPFHYGPRACLGRNLAYTEMRVIFAKMVYNFDMKLAPESSNWFNQKMFTLWEKPPLMVHLTPAKGREHAKALA